MTHSTTTDPFHQIRGPLEAAVDAAHARLVELVEDDPRWQVELDAFDACKWVMRTAGLLP